MNYLKTFKCAALISIVLSSSTALAFEQQASSIGGVKNHISHHNIAQQLLQSNNNANLAERSVTSVAPIIKNQPEKQRNLAQSLMHVAHVDHSFSIYTAETKLINDYDEDGYFQTFSIDFDADLLSYSLLEQADVYAEMYLSFNGGPWQHYLTTDIFTLYGESSDDIYSIHTRLNQGYISGEYDILIDLYEVGFSDIVASYSGYDDAALAALPLESDEYDEVYVVEQHHTDIHHHGGSTGYLAIAFMLAAAVYRQFSYRKVSAKNLTQ